MMRRVPGIEKIKELTGFEPKTNLDTILEYVIDYMKRY
jgi:nucleoside-diphosphate-sugar epimerase